MAQGDNFGNQKVQSGNQPVGSTIPANTNKNVPSSTSTSFSTGSPWDEEVDVPEVTPKNKPTIIGTFNEPAIEPAKPFSVPQNVSEAVGKKISAAAIVNQNPAVPAPAQNKPQTAPMPAKPVRPIKPPVGGDVQSKAPVSTTAAADDDLLGQIDWFGDVGSNPDAVATNPAPSAGQIKTSQVQAKALSVNPPSNAHPVTQNSSQPNQSSNSLINSIKSRISDNKSQPVRTTPTQVGAPNLGGGTPAYTGPGMRGKISPGALESSEKKEKRSFSLKKTLLFSFLGILIVVIGLVALNELGIFSIGFEKVYGAIGLESLWGGLPIKSENALAMSAVKTVQHPTFKAKGKIVASVNSSIKSGVTDPLISSGNSITLRDQAIAMTQEGILAQTSGNSADVYNSSSLPASSSSSSTSGSTISASSSQNNTSTTGSTATTNSNSSDSAAASSPIKSVTTQVQYKSTGNGSEADLTVGSSSFILKNQQEKLFVNGNANISYGENKDASKWVEYDFGQLKDKVVQKNIFDIKTASGYSAKGSRISEEVVGGVRCYKYNVQSLEIGNSLASIGIGSDSIQSISGDVWIGVRDKLIRKVSLNIVPSPSISITSMQVDLEFYDFDVTNTIQQINSSDVVPSTAPADLNTIESRDAKRKADVKSLLAALKLYKTDAGAYPVSKSLLNLSQSKNIIETALVPKYLSALPADPKTGYYYAYSSDGTECSVSARLENQDDAVGQLINNVLLYLQYNNN